MSAAAGGMRQAACLRPATMHGDRNPVLQPTEHRTFLRSNCFLHPTPLLLLLFWVEGEDQHMHGPQLSLGGGAG